MRRGRRDSLARHAAPRRLGDKSRLTADVPPQLRPEYQIGREKRHGTKVVRGLIEQPGHKTGLDSEPWTQRGLLSRSKTDQIGAHIVGRGRGRLLGGTGTGPRLLLGRHDTTHGNSLSARSEWSDRALPIRRPRRARGGNHAI